MTERKVYPVDDDEEGPTLPVIRHVRVGSSSSVKSEYQDPFSIQGEDIKSLRGIETNVKRRIQTKINKFQQGQGGAKSVRLEDKDFVTAYDAFGVVTPPQNLDYLAKLYELSAPHRAAVDAKTSNIVGLGYKFVETSKTKFALEDISDNDKKLKKVTRALAQHKEELLDTLETFNDEDAFTEILIKVWRDYETMGNGYLEIGRKRDKTIGYLGHIPAQTMRVRRDRDGFVQMSSNKVQFFRNFGDQKTLSPINSEASPNEIIHIKKSSPTSSFYGIPEIISAEQAIAGNEFVGRFNLDYFEHKAVPRHLILLKGATLGTSAEASLLSFFETGLKGKNHRTIYIPLPGDTDTNKVDFKIEPIEAGIQEGSFEKYKKANTSEILMVHRVPITKISAGEGVNLAVARDADKTFKEQVCAPEQMILEKKLNKIIKELTDAFMLKLDEMTLTDANTQSQIDERMVKAGIWTANEPRARDGKPALKGGDDRVDLNAKDKLAQATSEANAQRQRDATRSANQTDNVGEGRNPKGDGRTTP